ncbi:MAG TPA: hypothetical protein VNT27_14375 [Propionibacteriaceae bacterium]|nr:hypothetical protein [Propionibacteriaceae bacterium]
MSHQQVAELAEAYREPYRLLVLFLAYTGVRFGQAGSPPSPPSRLPASPDPGGRIGDAVKGVMTFGDTKGHERREVLLPRILIDLASWSKARMLTIWSSPACAVR